MKKKRGHDGGRNLIEFAESVEEARILQRIRERKRGAIRATAQIVAWLRGPTPNIGTGRSVEYWKNTIADAIERDEYKKVSTREE